MQQCNHNFWSTMKVCVKVMEPAVKVLRYSDGMRGFTLGLMYNLLLQLDELYSSPIEGLPDKVRTKVYLKYDSLLLLYNAYVLVLLVDF